MKEHQLFYEIKHKSNTYYAYHLGFMEGLPQKSQSGSSTSPKYFIHLYNLDVKGKGQYTISYNSVDKLLNGDKKSLETYLK
jgi:hypothetical protein